MTIQPYRPPTLAVNIKDKNVLFTSFIWFFKTGGLFIATDKNYNMGEIIYLSIRLPNKKENEAPIPAKGYIAWLTPNSMQHKQSGIGIAFEDNESNKQLCNNILEIIKNISLNSARYTV